MLLITNNYIKELKNIFVKINYLLVNLVSKKHTNMAKVLIEKLTEAEITKRKIKSWPVWTKEISRFDWFYDSDEECLILEGEFVIHTDEGDYFVKPGDFVTFKKGLKCIWEVNKPIRKHYNFL
jgi:uncharacterized cupin superfamily protein